MKHPRAPAAVGLDVFREARLPRLRRSNQLTGGIR